MKSLRSIAKVIGTILCVAGAIAMALIKGPKLLNSEFIPTNGLLLLTLGKENNYENLDSNWMFGVILLIASAICWSLWLILQVYFYYLYCQYFYYFYCQYFSFFNIFIIL